MTSVLPLSAGLGVLPTEQPTIEEMVPFAPDYTLWLNRIFAGVSGAQLWLHFRGGRQGEAAGARSAGTELHRRLEMSRGTNLAALRPVQRGGRAPPCGYTANENRLQAAGHAPARSV